MHLIMHHLSQYTSSKDRERRQTAQLRDYHALRRVMSKIARLQGLLYIIKQDLVHHCTAMHA